VKKGIVTKNDAVWQGHPDVAMFKDRLFVVYRLSNRHMTNQKTAIHVIESNKIKDGFSKPIFEYESLQRLNCPRLSVIKDTLWLICDVVKSAGDYLAAENIEEQTRVILWYTQDGKSWSRPINSNIRGIVPDKMLEISDGKFAIATHTYKPFYTQEEESEINACVAKSPRTKSEKPETVKGRLIQNIWITTNIEGEWTKHSLACDWSHSFCEASISWYNNQMICLMRENSGKGLPAHLSYSYDGVTWTMPIRTRMFGCHRPVGGVLRSGNFLTTYRDAAHSWAPGFWAKNTFACLTHKDSVILKNNPFYRSVILPIDHDHSRQSDSGYTGWVQLPDDQIFIVNYITKDAPKPYITWYLIKESEF